MTKLLLTFTLITLYLTPLNGQSYEDKRCKCVCPSISSVLNNGNSDESRMLIIDNVPPNKCNCDSVILPKIEDKLNGSKIEFCPRCLCKYENRNTTTIKVVVTLVIFVISGLVIYMLFLYLLDPLLGKRMKVNYQEHTNEEEESVGASQIQLAFAGSSGRPEGGNVLSRVSVQQDKWKRQVKEQRKNIYDRHNMLN